MKRDASTNLDDFLQSPARNSPVLIVQGARQVGKTYLIKDVLRARPSAVSINLEEHPALKLAMEESADFAAFARLLKSECGFVPHESAILFIDEAQECQKLGSYVRFMKENWTDVKVILSGSSMTRLFSDDTRIPVGRIEYLHIHPFSFREFLRCLGCEALLDDALANEALPALTHEKILKHYDDFLYWGGLPEVVKAFAGGGNPDRVLAGIVASQRDDFLRKEKVKSYLFLDALKGIANHVGQPAKLTQVADSHYDAKKIVTALEAWHLVHTVDVKGAIATQAFLPKRYLYDTGVLRFLRATPYPRISVIDTVDERLRTPLGGVIENAVLLGLSHRYGAVLPISTWKKCKKDAIEVDFVLKDDRTTTPIEVKAALKLHERHAKNLLYYCQLFAVREAYLVSLAPRGIAVRSEQITVHNVPVYLAETLAKRGMLR